MWQTLLNLIQVAFTFAEKLQRIDVTLKEHGQSLRDVTANQQRLQHEFQLFKERVAHEREQEKLRLEIRQLREQLERAERLSLPPSPPKTPDEPSKN